MLKTSDLENNKHKMCVSSSFKNHLKPYQNTNDDAEADLSGSHQCEQTVDGQTAWVKKHNYIIWSIVDWIINSGLEFIGLFIHWIVDPIDWIQ